MTPRLFVTQVKNEIAVAGLMVNYCLRSSYPAHNGFFCLLKSEPFSGIEPFITAVLIALFVRYTST